MTDEMKAQLAQLLAFLNDSIKGGKEFVAEQAPQFVKEMLAWYFWESVIWIIIGVVVAIISYIAKRKIIESLDTKMYNYGESVTMINAIYAVVMAIAFIVICSNVMEAVKVKVAPRVVLVDQVKAMIRVQ